MSRDGYAGRRVVITGGLGFIGSNLAIALVEQGARVLLVDNMLPRQGGNLFNIEPIRDRVQVSFTDIRDPLSMAHIVKEQDLVFHLAGQVNHIDSIRNPLEDLDINCRGTLVLLEACRRQNPDVRIVFTGTRGQYGPSLRLPVREDHPTNPAGIYAITNLTAEKMVKMYHDVHKVRTVCLRMTNTYGPRHQMQHDEYGVVNWFLRRALDDEIIKVFGDGRILRDYLYVEDAVNALLAVGLSGRSWGEIFNIGTGVPTSFIDLAELIVRVAGRGRYEFTEFTKERLALEPGDYYTDITKVSSRIGWRPTVDLEEGLRRTVDFCDRHRAHYWSWPKPKLAPTYR